MKWTPAAIAKQNSERKAKRMAREAKIKKVDELIKARRAAKNPIFKRSIGPTKRYVVTCAQNATPIHKGFFDSLQTYCKVNKAELLIIPIRYRNATSQWTESQQDADFWEVPKDLLYNQRHQVNKNLMIMGDIKTQPTAVDPLVGFEAITAGSSGIFGHPKLRLKTVAAPQGKLPKILTTSGAVTLPNYVDSRTGKTGEFHHTLGATLVEVRGKIFHMRQLMGDKHAGGGFYDLENFYSPQGRSTRPSRALSLTTGDVHVEDTDALVDKITFSEIVPTLKPKAWAVHDLLSGISVNHHTDRNPFVGISRALRGQSNVVEEIHRALEYVKTRAHSFDDVGIIPSNHNDWIHYWLLNSDWRTMNPLNRQFYLEMALVLAAKARTLDVSAAERLNAFVEYARKWFADSNNIRVLNYDDSWVLGEIEHGMHGHLGPNGRRGNLRNLRRIGIKSNTGHSHTPGIDEGAWAAGTLTKLRLGYNKGPSGWLQSNILTYANSKRCLLHIIEGGWRL